MEEIYKILEGIKPQTDFRNSEDYIEEGLLDSLEIIDLIEIIEKKYHIMLDGADFDPDNFVSVETIWKMISKYL